SRPAYYYVDNNGGNSIWWSNGKVPDELKVMKNYQWASYFYYDASIASSYFDKAIRASNDPELKAKALYMKAKVEKTLDYPFDFWNEDNTNSNEKYWQCFEELKKDYSKTAYYQEIL